MTGRPEDLSTLVEDGAGLVAGNAADATSLQLLHRYVYLWTGFANQALSSATNFGLTLLAGRLLGPEGLGIVFVGFSTYLVALGFLRAFVTDPYLSSNESNAFQGEYVTSVIVSAAVLTILAVGTGQLASGYLSVGIRAAAPWLFPILVQDAWRSYFFKNNRGRAAILNDGVWTLGMLGLLPIALKWPSVETSFIAWGGGATIAALFGLFQLKVRPRSFRRSLEWWGQVSGTFGTALAVGSAITASASYLVIIVLSVVLGVEQVGGLRSVQSLFAPVSVIGPALTFPGLPSIAAASESHEEARKLSRSFSAAAAALTTFYVLPLGFLSVHILSKVFTSEFAEFGPLTWPVGIAQIFLAAELGYVMYMKVRRSWGGLLKAWTAGSVANLVLASVMAVAWGLEGAAFGLATGAVIRFSAMGLGFLRARPHGEESAG